MAQKEIPVGETFSHCHVLYEVREEFSCKGCSFFIEDENVCTDSCKRSLPSCSSIDRHDGKDVIYVQINEL